MEFELEYFLQELQEKVLQYHPGKKPKEGSYMDVSTDTIRQGEFDSVMCHWQNRSDKFREQKDNMLKDYQKAQGWLYRLLCASFAQTNLTKIYRFTSQIRSATSSSKRTQN